MKIQKIQKILISIPEPLLHRMKVIISPRQRSKLIVSLIEKEVSMQEEQLYKTALAVEQDALLNEEMDDWNVTIQDGLNHESW